MSLVRVQSGVPLEIKRLCRLQPNILFDSSRFSHLIATITLASPPVDESFRDPLLAMVRKGGKTIRKRGSHSGAAVAAHGEQEAEHLVSAGLRQLELCDGKGNLLPARKGDSRKVALATLLRTHTAMGNKWVAHRLEMGHDKSVSRLIRQGGAQREVKKFLRSLEQMLPCED